MYTPANVGQAGGSRPLVLVIHGGGSTDRGMTKLDKGRWQELADLHGFYVVYPNAVDKLWDFGERLCPWRCLFLSSWKMNVSPARLWA
ncbi:MAG: hypothetical protein AB8C02_14430 [Halioglobus sp.]